MKPSNILPLIIISFLLFGCEKENSELVLMVINETQCANEWDNLGQNSTEENVTEYLKENNIQILDISIEVYSSGPFCSACTCLSGRTINVQIESKDQKKIKRLGFIEK